MAAAAGGSEVVHLLVHHHGTGAINYRDFPARHVRPHVWLWMRWVVGCGGGCVCAVCRVKKHPGTPYTHTPENLSARAARAPRSIFYQNTFCSRAS